MDNKDLRARPEAVSFVPLDIRKFPEERGTEHLTPVSHN